MKSFLKMLKEVNMDLYGEHSAVNDKSPLVAAAIAELNSLGITGDITTAYYSYAMGYLIKDKKITELTLENKTIKVQDLLNATKKLYAFYACSVMTNHQLDLNKRGDEIILDNITYEKYKKLENYYVRVFLSGLHYDNGIFYIAYKTKDLSSHTPSHKGEFFSIDGRYGNVLSFDPLSRNIQPNPFRTEKSAISEISTILRKSLQKVINKKLVKEASYVLSSQIPDQIIQRKMQIMKTICEEKDIDFDRLIQRIKSLSRYSKTSKENSFKTAIIALSLYNGRMVEYTKHFPKFLDQLMLSINSSIDTQSSTVIYDDEEIEFLPDNKAMKDKLFSDQDLLLYRNKIVEMLNVLQSIGGKAAVNYLFYFAWEYMERAGVTGEVDIDTRDGEGKGLLLMARYARDDKNFWQVVQSKFEEAKERFSESQQKRA